MGKQVMMVISMMKGAGAERVSALLMNEFYRNGHDVQFVLTSSTSEEVIRTDLIEEIPLILLRENKVEESVFTKYKMRFVRVYSSAFCRFFEAMKKPVPQFFAYSSFICQYWKEVKQLREMMKENPELIVISFLQPSVPMVLLAARGLPNRVIISERDNPKRLMKKRYGRPFVERYYPRADRVVYQTEDAKNTYPISVSKKGLVIPNPVKKNLPVPFKGERNKKITTFCRISKQKNLPVLIDAFAMLYKEHPEYELKIIGDAFNEEGIEVRDKAKAQIESLGIGNAVRWCPFSAKVHQDIISDAMYVNSSDYEGMSNAMLEAMAIGMPVVCTDCPIGGARAIIQDGENGLLVPVGDANAIYLAMKKIVEDREFADKIAHNAAKLREELSLENIAKRWMELL